MLLVSDASIGGGIARSKGCLHRRTQDGACKHSKRPDLDVFFIFDVKIAQDPGLKVCQTSCKHVLIQQKVFGDRNYL